MATATFYHPDLRGGDVEIELSAEESAHALKSRRLGMGDSIDLINGTGISARAQISRLEKKAVRAVICDITQHSEPNFSVTIFAAIPKGDRQRTMIDMLTQLGVAEITPLHCAYSVTRFSKNMHRKWQRTAVEACKQSRNPWLPQINDSVALGDFLQQKAVPESNAFFADQSGMEIEKSSLSGMKALVFVGPEGGFSTAEVSAFITNGIVPIKLGRHILRSETAAVAAAILLCH